MPHKGDLSSHLDIVGRRSSYDLEDQIARLERRAETTERMLRELLTVVSELKQQRRVSTKLAAVRDVPRPDELTDADIAIGRQYIVDLRLPKGLVPARIVITKVDAEGAEKLYNFSRADIIGDSPGRPPKARPARDFRPVPKDWKDPATPEVDEESGPSQGTNRPPSNRSSQPARRDRTNPHG